MRSFQEVHLVLKFFYFNKYSVHRGKKPVQIREKNELENDLQNKNHRWALSGAESSQWSILSDSVIWFFQKLIGEILLCFLYQAQLWVLQIP